MPPFVDLKGQRFGRLVATHLASKSPSMWACKCDCGGNAVIARSNLRKGRGRPPTMSCGCILPEVLSRRSTHGQSKTVEYKTWKGIKERCMNSYNSGWEHYGGRGIKVCDRWVDSFEAFLADMGPRPSSQHSIDRINTNGNYEPVNCRWATTVEQANNKTNSTRVQAFGVVRTVPDWARSSGLPDHVIRRRLGNGTNPEVAVTKPKRVARRFSDQEVIAITLDARSLRKIGREYGVHHGAISKIKMKAAST